MAGLFDTLTGLNRRIANARVRRTELQRLSGAGDTTSGKLARAIDTVVRKTLLDDEESWIRSIERCREELADSNGEVSFTDYGAGEPDDQLDRKEMEEGREIRLSLTHLCHHTSQAYPWAHLFFQLVRELRPHGCLEMGTCLGFSACYQAAALELNQTGHLVTLEGAQPLADIARGNFEKVGLKRVIVRVGRFQDTLADVLQEHGPFDFVFVDGHHDGEATQAYFEQILPSLNDDGIVVFDDILWYDGMRDAWSRIQAHDRARVSVDLGAMGIIVVSTEPNDKASYSLSLY